MTDAKPVKASFARFTGTRIRRDIQRSIEDHARRVRSANRPRCLTCGAWLCLQGWCRNHNCSDSR